MPKFRAFLRDQATRADIRLVQGGTDGTVGSPITSADLLYNGAELAEEYSLTASNVSGGTFDLLVEARNGLGPYHDTTFSGVVADGATHWKKLGLDVVFSGTIANGQLAKIFVGLNPGSLRAGNPTGTQKQLLTNPQVTNYASTGDWGSDDVDPGAPGAIALLWLENVSSTVASATEFVRRAVITQKYRTDPLIFSGIDVATDAADETAASDGTLKPVKVRTANVSGGEGDLEFSVWNGSSYDAFTTIDVRDVDDTAATDVPSVDLDFGGSARYQVTESGHPLEGVILTIASTAATGSIVNLLVQEPRITVVASYNGGTYPVTNAGWEDESLELTQDGETAGIVQPGEGVNVFVAWIVPGNTTPIATAALDWQVEYDESNESDWDA
jgi:hypothetical protein